ncbi:site-specific integrase [Pseudoalteromonas piscicida]|uniref:site-specific integrase n=1 Tax=Pseudoalteromonas piscicida TaxID=43662 RepID=UPI003C7BBD81
MANLERTHYHPMKFTEGDSGDLSWTVDDCQLNVPNCPQIFFENGEPWIAANLFAVARIERGTNIKTVVSDMNHLRAYAEWLESENMDWTHFPIKKKERCLFRYRGNLIGQRDSGALSPSTISSRMSSVIKFYRWARTEGRVKSDGLWKDHEKIIQTHNAVGLKRSILVNSSELAIPNRKRPGATLEGGLLPISEVSRKKLLSFLLKHEMTELYLMFVIGFFTGARIETIRTLRLTTLDNAFDDPSVINLKRVPVGPPTRVKTKYGVSGDLLFPRTLIEQLQKYAVSPRRLVRQSRASDENKSLLFLTSNGQKYVDNSFTSIMSKLRKKLVNCGLGEFGKLKFHQSRATYGSQLMLYALKSFKSQKRAIVFVRDAMFHKDESTTWKYVTFLENEPVKEMLSDEFFNFFSGSELLEPLIEEVTYGTDS